MTIERRAQQEWEDWNPSWLFNSSNQNVRMGNFNIAELRETYLAAFMRGFAVRLTEGNSEMGEEQE